MSRFESIPGETPIDDISGLKLKHVHTRKELAAAEAENIRKAVVKYFATKPSRRIAPFDLTWCMNLHREMFGEVWDWAGSLRTVELNLGLPPHQLLSHLKNTVDDLAYWKTNWPDLMDQAAHLHHRTVRIHPFLNGNGRWARMLANIWLRTHDAPVTIWPEDTIGSISTIREEYLNAIRDADNGRFDPLIELHRRFAE